MSFKSCLGANRWTRLASFLHMLLIVIHSCQHAAALSGSSCKYNYWFSSFDLWRSCKFWTSVVSPSRASAMRTSNSRTCNLLVPICLLHASRVRERRIYLLCLRLWYFPSPYQREVTWLAFRPETSLAAERCKDGGEKAFSNNISVVNSCSGEKAFSFNISVVNRCSTIVVESY